MELTKQRKTLLETTGVAILLAIIGMVSGNPGILGNLLLIAIIIVVLPPFLYRYRTYRRVKSLEDQFPNFVRDLADSRRSGMSFPASIKLATKANYGKLSEEIQHMHNKLSWGIPFLRVLDLFQKRVKESKLIIESLTIIRESYQAGGDIAATLDAIARDLTMLKETESERVSLLRQNVMIMYGIFFMFIGIAIMIIFVMVPLVQASPNIQSGGFGFAFTDPCEGTELFPCNLFRATGIFLGVPVGIANYYISIFFFVVLIQGIFIGLITGQIGENSITAGTKHSLIMGFSGIGIFLFLAQTGLFPF